MKKTLLIIFLIVLFGTLSYFIYTNYIEGKIKKVEIENEYVDITEYYIYGNHLNMKGSLVLPSLTDDSFEDVKLVLYNGIDHQIDISYKNTDSKIDFYISEEINNGLYLDDIERGEYYLFLRLEYDTQDEKESAKTYKYYALKNTTKYEDVKYYTLSKYNNEIQINSNNDYPTMMMTIKENKNKNEIADITIDPGHGGMDSGGLSNEYLEKDFTISISKKLQKEFEKLGLKVKMTHDGSMTKNELLDEYNKNGRAIIPNEVKSKYTLSIHINKSTSSKVSGLEVYTPANINYDLAKSFAEKITSYTGLNYSSNKMFKKYDGVYTHNFTESEIESSLKSYEEKNYKPYNVTTNSNYLYMIRETGGFMTGAYIDNGNPEKVGINPYYDSNVGNESYLLELGYISNSNDLDILINNEDNYVKAIVDSMKEELGL